MRTNNFGKTGDFVGDLYADLKAANLVHQQGGSALGQGNSEKDGGAGYPAAQIAGHSPRGLRLGEHLVNPRGMRFLRNLRCQSRFRRLARSVGAAWVGSSGQGCLG